jgi:lipoprotein-releasing system permease protein
VYRLFLAQRYLKSRLVNLIAVGGVMFGVAVLIVVTSVMDGFRDKVLTVLRGNLSDIVMTPVLPPGESLPPFEAVDRAIRQDDRVQATAPQLERVVFYLYKAFGTRHMAVNGQAVQEMRAVGIDFERERQVSAIADYLVAANDFQRPFYSPRALDRDRAGTVLMSRTFAERYWGLGTAYTLPEDLLETEVAVTFLDLPGSREPEPPIDYGSPDGDGSPDDEERPPGRGPPAGEEPPASPPSPEDGIRVSWRTLKLPVSGVYDAKDTSLDGTQLYMDIATLRRVARIDDAYHVIRVKLKDPNQAEAVKADFKERFPRFETTVWTDHRRDYLRAVENEKVMLAIVLSFIVLLGGFIILATLSLTVVEKTRDIGILGALGANHGGVLSLFVGTGMLIGVIGAALGVGLGYLFTSNVNAIKDFLADKMGVQIFPADIYLFREIPTVWSWPTVGWIVGGSLFMALVAGLIPAIRAARMDPVKALRYE